MHNPAINFPQTVLPKYDPVQSSVTKAAAQPQYAALTSGIRSVIFSPANVMRGWMSQTQDPTKSDLGISKKVVRVTPTSDPTLDVELSEIISEGKAYKSESEDMLVPTESDKIDRPPYQSNKNVSSKQAILFGLLTLGATAGAGGLIYSAWRNNSGSKMAGSSNTAIPEPWMPHTPGPVIDTATQTAMRGRRHTDSCPPQPVLKKCQDVATIQTNQGITVNKMWVLMGSEYCECPSDALSPDPHASNLDYKGALIERLPDHFPRLAQHNRSSSDGTAKKTG